jgi:hypothetical protein
MNPKPCFVKITRYITNGGKKLPQNFVYFCKLLQNTQSKQSPNRRKIAQSGHPGGRLCTYKLFDRLKTKKMDFQCFSGRATCATLKSINVFAGFKRKDGSTETPFLFWTEFFPSKTFGSESLRTIVHCDDTTGEQKMLLFKNRFFFVGVCM